jgi:hypothetical protein
MGVSLAICCRTGVAPADAPNKARFLDQDSHVLEGGRKSGSTNRRGRRRVDARLGR